MRKIKEWLGHRTIAGLITGAVLMLVMAVLLSALLVFLSLYRNSMTENAVTAGDQAVVQVVNAVTNYTEEIEELMACVRTYVASDNRSQFAFFDNLMRTRTDVVAVITYDKNGNMEKCWAGEEQVKSKWLKNLSRPEADTGKGLRLSAPHVESLFQNSYPWVVSISDEGEDAQGNPVQIVMDIRFSSIMNYVDTVGIGQHGYCFLMNKEGTIIYHPQQRLIYSNLKEEQTDWLKEQADGITMDNGVIYTIQTLETCNWRVIGVCYADEMVGAKVETMLKVSVILMAMFFLVTFAVGWLISRLISRPSRELARAMGAFEEDAKAFRFVSVGGTAEISRLSDSFGHMVVRIQQLMEQVRQEEITLRKTELNALQTQINPHFLYNTLSSIAWMCEEERSAEAVEMVNALGQLFRISISKGHELIPIGQELQHAKSYLQIQNFRYKNQFTYEFEVDEDCLGYYCNKITLQPIIENAIYHGLDRMVDEGRIVIRVYQKDNDIFMEVEDNGVGMTQELCHEILERDPKRKTGIGIKNVNDRVRIYFGSEYGMTITSELDEGTCVKIRMPKVTQEQEFSSADDYMRRQADDYGKDLIGGKERENVGK